MPLRERSTGIAQNAKERKMRYVRQGAHASKHTLAHTIRHAHAHSLDEFQEHTQIKCTLFTSAPASRRLSSIGVFSHEAAINRGVAPVRV